LLESLRIDARNEEVRVFGLEPQQFVANCAAGYLAAASVVN